MDSFKGPPVSFLNAWHCRAVNAGRHAGDRGLDKGQRFTKDDGGLQTYRRIAGQKVWLEILER
jgi:hypothetical protein